jgi:hypothetical protein
MVRGGRGSQQEFTWNHEEIIFEKGSFWNVADQSQSSHRIEGICGSQASLVFRQPPKIRENIYNLP